MEKKNKENITFSPFDSGVRTRANALTAGSFEALRIHFVDRKLQRRPTTDCRSRRGIARRKIQKGRTDKECEVARKLV